MTEVSFDADGSLLGPLREAVGLLEREAKLEAFSPPTVARLPRFLRTFYLRFLDEVLDVQIERFGEEERDQISDLAVDLEEEEKWEETWALLFDFTDLCDYFEDFGLLSVPEAAREHEPEIFELTARVLADLATWAASEPPTGLSDEASNLAKRLESLVSHARAG